MSRQQFIRPAVVERSYGQFAITLYSPGRMPESGVQRRRKTDLCNKGMRGHNDEEIYDEIISKISEEENNQFDRDNDRIVAIKSNSTKPPIVYPF